jgi:hypothetical protein
MTISPIERQICDYISEEAHAFSYSQSRTLLRQKIIRQPKGLDVTIIITRMLFKEHKLLIANRINISSDNDNIKNLFRKFLTQPSYLHTDKVMGGKWNPNLWVFIHDPHVLSWHSQYELRFFPDETSMKNTPEEEEKKKRGANLHFLNEKPPLPMQTSKPFNYCILV